MTVFWIIIVVQAIASAALASTIAANKGHSKDSWLAAGFFLGILGLIAAAGLPDTYARAGSRGRTAARETGRLCPDCAEPIRSEALVCCHCGHRFERADVIAEAAEILGGEDVDARADAVRVLSWIGGDETIPHLRRALKRCRLHTCATAVDALRRSGARAAVPDILDLLQPVTPADASWADAEHLNHTAIDALAELADSSIADQLAAFLEAKGTADFKIRIARLAGTLSAATTVPALLNAADGNRVLRVHMLAAIESMGQFALPELRKELETARRGRGKRIESIMQTIAARESSGEQTEEREPN